MHHFPKHGDKVNDASRLHANGFVQRILYDDGPKEVIVKFDDGVVCYDFEEFRHSWTEGYGGCFVLDYSALNRRSVEWRTKVRRTHE